MGWGSFTPWVTRVKRNVIVNDYIGIAYKDFGPNAMFLYLILRKNYDYWDMFSIRITFGKDFVFQAKYALHVLL